MVRLTITARLTWRRSGVRGASRRGTGCRDSLEEETVAGAAAQRRRSTALTVASQAPR